MMKGTGVIRNTTDCEEDGLLLVSNKNSIYGRTLLLEVDQCHGIISIIT